MERTYPVFRSTQSRLKAFRRRRTITTAMDALIITRFFVFGVQSGEECVWRWHLESAMWWSPDWSSTRTPNQTHSRYVFRYTQDRLKHQYRGMYHCGFHRASVCDGTTDVRKIGANRPILWISGDNRKYGVTQWVSSGSISKTVSYSSQK